MAIGISIMYGGDGVTCILDQLSFAASLGGMVWISCIMPDDISTSRHGDTLTDRHLSQWHDIDFDVPCLLILALRGAEMLNRRNPLPLMGYSAFVT